MRIISGSHRGRKIIPPHNLPVRPTTDLAKESLFNILWNYLEFSEIRVLDLFAGTGNISLEFASRGAVEVVAVDQHPRCSDFIRKMAMQLDFRNLKVIRADVVHFLKHPGLPFDVIFADPPYDLQEIRLVPAMVFDQAWLNPGGWLIVEHPKEVVLSDHPMYQETRIYGKVNFSFFRNPE